MCFLLYCTVLRLPETGLAWELLCGAGIGIGVGAGVGETLLWEHCLVESTY